MQYAVQVTTTFEPSFNANRDDRGWTRTHFIPALSRQDANDIVDALRDNLPRVIEDGDMTTTRQYETVAVVRTKKGLAYLDATTMEQLAIEYTTPASRSKRGNGVVHHELEPVGPR